MFYLYLSELNPRDKLLDSISPRALLRGLRLFEDPCKIALFQRSFEKYKNKTNHHKFT
jgi:hypothetical protein